MSVFPCLPSKIPLSLRNRIRAGFYGDQLWINSRISIRISLTASLADKNSRPGFALISWTEADPIDYNGWDVNEYAPDTVNRNGFKAFPVFVTAGAIAAVLGLIYCFTLRDRVYGFRPLFDGGHGVSLSSINQGDNKNEEVSLDEIVEDAKPRNESIVATAFEERGKQKPARLFASFTVDPTQQESFLLLKKLKIVEDDARAEELCMRREYARWLVGTNSLLERKRKHRISTGAALSGSAAIAFDDVPVEDPDFEFIQSLAEVGVTRSKLFIGKNPDTPGDDNRIYFFPDRFLSRWDLVTWRARLEYDPSVQSNVEVSRMKVDFLDLGETSSDESLELWLDTLADDDSIIRSVFGNCKRLQPHKPCTKAQAAVALTSGRMNEFVRVEISRLEAESFAQQNDRKEVMSELLEKGDINSYWDRLIQEERNRGMEAELEYCLAHTAFEQEKNHLESTMLELVKQRASLECEKELVATLRAEVMDMSETLSFERAVCINEHHGMQDRRMRLESERKKLHDAKSILEAEAEAVRIMRSWVEEEARKNQARAKVLKAAAQRWKWDS